MEHLAAHSHDFSVYGLIMSADPIVKGVMLILLFASITCWAVIFEKIIRLTALGHTIRRLQKIAEGKADPAKQRGLVRDVLTAASIESNAEIIGHESLTEYRGRLERAMRAALRTDLQKAEVGLPILATTGSAAPFVGLFGTVWGIVNSFTSIAQQKDTSLAVVAPGIAEALVATAMGLAAAIPAVVAYNMIAVRLSRLSTRGNSAIMKIVRRYYDQSKQHLRKAAE